MNRAPTWSFDQAWAIDHNIVEAAGIGPGATADAAAGGVKVLLHSGVVGGFVEGDGDSDDVSQTTPPCKKISPPSITHRAPATT